ncbi:glycosyltransferase [Bacteroides thetaiotaomicron]|nr:glycosyltransferase [Bacteroides thetaiotaomicron]
MPTVVLEAMAFGLPVFTRNVGGLIDFFENGKMGYITDSMDPKDFADAISSYIEDVKLTKATSLYNYEYARKHFMASFVAVSIEKQLKKGYLIIGYEIIKN